MVVIILLVVLLLVVLLLGDHTIRGGGALTRKKGTYISLYISTHALNTLNIHVLHHTEDTEMALHVSSML